MGRHDALGGGGAGSVHVPLAVPTTPLPLVGRLLTDSGGLALVLAGVLVQDVQGLGLRGGFAADGGAGSGLLPLLGSTHLTAVWRKRVARGQVGT